VQKNLPFPTIILENLLTKNAKQKQSHTKSKAERFENIKNTFSVNNDFNLARGFAAGQNLFILIDDVTTSGATLAEAKNTIAKSLSLSEDQILGITLAH
jgi:predicted amidophosphoribosyltransferase